MHGGQLTDCALNLVRPVWVREDIYPPPQRPAKHENKPYLLERVAKTQERDLNIVYIGLITN